MNQSRARLSMQSRDDKERDDYYKHEMTGPRAQCSLGILASLGLQTVLDSPASTSLHSRS